MLHLSAFLLGLRKQWRIHGTPESHSFTELEPTSVGGHGVSDLAPPSLPGHVQELPTVARIPDPQGFIWGGGGGGRCVGGPRPGGP